MGTADFAAVTLAALAQYELVELLAVVTQPDRPKGRALQLTPSAVKIEASRRRLPILQPEKTRESAFIEELRRLAPDLIVVAAYGQILPQAILEIPARGCLNVHASLLPRYRGAAPIQWAILNGEQETGVTIMQMDAGCDTGPMLTLVHTPIHPDDTAQTLHDRLASMGAALLVQTIPAYLREEIIPRPQPNVGATYARKISKDDGLVDWTRSAVELERQVRGLHPWPGAYTFTPSPSGKNLLKIQRAIVEDHAFGTPGQVIWANTDGITVACGTTALRILELQREGGKSLCAGDFLRGHPLPGGTLLGKAP